MDRLVGNANIAMQVGMTLVAPAQMGLEQMETAQVAERLAQHFETALGQVNERLAAGELFSNEEVAQIADNPSVMNRSIGNHVDAAWKALINADQELIGSGVQTTARGIAGPDVWTPYIWADSTTEAEWLSHVELYGPGYGEGYPFLWQRVPGSFGPPQVQGIVTPPTGP
jgi:hypothetical protein